MRYIYYHSADLDGHCSGEIAYRALYEQNNSNIKLIGINYGEPLQSHIDTDEIWFVDFCPDIMPEAGIITIIDHHKTKDYIQVDINAGKYRGEVNSSGATPSERVSACELCWKWFYNPYHMPLFVRLLGRYDVWDHFNPQVLPFQYGMRTYDTTPGQGEVWDELFNGNSIEQICMIGDRLIFKEEKDNSIRMKHAFSYKLIAPGGIHVIYVIASIGAPCSSQAFKSVYDASHHIAMMSIVSRGPLGWRISLYNNNDQMDLTPIAKAFGGGGHAHACGFQVKSLKCLGLEL